jgi:hypothetical protein
MYSHPSSRHQSVIASVLVATMGTLAITASTNFMGTTLFSSFDRGIKSKSKEP